jgi:hypothetical protein
MRVSNSLYASVTSTSPSISAFFFLSTNVVGFYHDVSVQCTFIEIHELFWSPPNAPHHFFTSSAGGAACRRILLDHCSRYSTLTVNDDKGHKTLCPLSHRGNLPSPKSDPPRNLLLSIVGRLHVCACVWLQGYKQIPNGHTCIGAAQDVETLEITPNVGWYSNTLLASCPSRRSERPTTTSGAAA